MTVWGIVLAAGSGSRFGSDTPKQFASLGGRRVIDWSLDAARASTDGVVLVVGEEYLDDPAGAGHTVVVGGATRSASVASGLAAVPASAELIVVHDGARPLASPALFARVIGAVRGGADAAVPALPITDTIKRVDGDLVVETVDRASLVGVQTPQAFRAGVLRRAHSTHRSATDDAALVETLGGRVVTVPGEPANLKITTPFDLVVAELRIR